MPSNTAASSDFGIFLPPNIAERNSSWAVSVVDVCNYQNTYAIQCMTGKLPSSATCGPNAPFITIAEGFTGFAFATATPTAGGTASISQTCTLNDGAATCTADYEISAHGSKTHSAVTAEFTDEQFQAQLFHLNITAGAAKITNSSASTCTSGAAHSSGTVHSSRPAGVVSLGILVMFSVLFVCRM